MEIKNRDSYQTYVAKLFQVSFKGNQRYKNVQENSRQ